MGAAYRCDECREQLARCPACRARRAAANAERRAQHRQAGKCVMCWRDPLPGLTRCAIHAEQNAALSAASHSRSRRGAKDGA